MAKRVPAGEVKVAATRIVKSGHLHEAGALVGYYADTVDVPIGGQMMLHTRETVEIVAPSALTLSVGATVNFNFTTQEAVASGGTNIGKAVYAKTNGQTFIIVALNNTGMVVA